MVRQQLGQIVIATVIAIFIPLSLASQTGQVLIWGKVVENETGHPIPGATIRLGQTEQATLTDSLGRYQIETDLTGSITLRVSSLGFNALEQQISLNRGDTIRIEFRMASTLTEIRGMRVNGQREEAVELDAHQPVSIVTPEQFDEQSFSTTAELLREEPGVLVQKTTHGHGAPVIRGLIGKYVLLLYDGLRLNRPTFRFGANQYMNTISKDWLSSIVVTRGPASVLYGSDALGGAINMVSYSPGFSSGPWQYKSSGGVRYSSADEGIALNNRISVSGRRFSAWGGITYKDIGDLKAGGDIGTQSPTGWDEVDFIGQTNLLINDKQLSFQYLSTHQNEVHRYDRYESGSFEQYLYDPQDRKMAVLSFQDLSGEGRKTASRISLSYSKEDEGQTERRTGSDITTVSMQEVTTWGGFGQVSIVPEADSRLTFGGEYFHDRVTGSRYSFTPTDTTAERPAYPNGSTYKSVGLYSEYARPFAYHWELTAGVRYSRISLRTELEPPFGLLDELFSNVTGALSLVHHLSPETNLLARWSRGFRAPNLNDLASLGTSSSGVDAPSPGVRPETTDDYEIGYRKQTESFTGALYLYYSRLHNLIDRRPGLYDGLTFFDDNDNGIQDEGEADVYQKMNVGEAEIYGFELDLGWWLTESTRLHSNLFYTRGENSTDNEPLSRIPPLMGNFSLRHSLSPDSWIELLIRAATDQRRLSQRDIDDSRIGPDGTDSWGTFNLRAATEWNRLEFSLTLQNLTDSGYKEHGSGVYSPGRGIILGISY